MRDEGSPARAGLLFFRSGRAPAPVRALAAAWAMAAICAACGTRPGVDQVSIVSYNAMAFFDGRDDGLEYPDYRAADGEWGPGPYRERLSNLKTALLACAPGGPDLACLAEIENQGVLSDLRALMSASEYDYCGFAGGDTSTGCGILSRLPVMGLKSHRPSLSGQAEPFRPILEAELDLKGVRMFVFVNHWKSKSGGEEKTEDQRVASAALLAQLMAERMAAFPDAVCIACGDMNEEAAASSALYPVALGRLKTAGSSVSCIPPGGCPIILSDRPRGGSASPAPEMPGGREGRKATILVSPWLFPENEGEWSYWWKDKGERIDHFFLSPSLFDGQAWELMEFAAVRDDILLDDSGKPLSWDAASRKGFSDHLPLRITLAFSQ